jgi:hypothetical protein
MVALDTSRRAVPSADLPAWRLNVMRVGYVLLAFALGMQVWPGIVTRHAGWELMDGVVQCMLGALSLLSLLGLRHPLKMAPLLLFEIAWKVIWLSVVAYPKWTAGRMDEGTMSVAFACLFVVIFPLVIPWRAVVQALVLSPGDRWR